MRDLQASFSLERPRPLLLASVSQAAAGGNGPGGIGKLELPNPAEALRRLGAKPSPAQASSQAQQRVPRPRRVQGPDLGAAGAQLQHAAAVAGGVLVAAIGQAVQRVLAARPRLPPRRSQNPVPFYQTFRLPWDRTARSGSRRCAAGGQRLSGGAASWRRLQPAFDNSTRGSTPATRAPTLPPPARAALPPCRATREAAALACALAARGHEYERALDVRAAVQCFEEACKLVPGSVPYLSMAAKTWSDLTFYYDVRTDRERQLVNLKALEYAEKVPGRGGGGWVGVGGLLRPGGRALAGLQGRGDWLAARGACRRLWLWPAVAAARRRVCLRLSRKLRQPPPAACDQCCGPPRSPHAAVHRGGAGLGVRPRCHVRVQGPPGALHRQQDQGGREGV